MNLISTVKLINSIPRCNDRILWTTSPSTVAKITREILKASSLKDFLTCLSQLYPNAEKFYSTFRNFSYGLKKSGEEWKELREELWNDQIIWRDKPVKMSGIFARVKGKIKSEEVKSFSVIDRIVCLLDQMICFPTNGEPFIQWINFPDITALVMYQISKSGMKMSQIISELRARDYSITFVVLRYFQQGKSSNGKDWPELRQKLSELKIKVKESPSIVRKCNSDFKVKIIDKNGSDLQWLTDSDTQDLMIRVKYGSLSHLNLLKMLSDAKIVPMTARFTQAEKA